MKTLILFLTFWVLNPTTLFSQQKQNSGYSIEIKTPKGWIEMDEEKLLKNIAKFEFKEDDLEKIIKDFNGNMNLFTYFKYNPKTHSGLIPSFGVNLRKTSTKNYEEFKEVITKSADQIKGMLQDFEYIIPPSDVSISNIKGVYFVAKFTMKTNNGDTYKARTRTYAIPVKDYFYQISFNDGQEEEDCKPLFDSLEKTMKISYGQ